jgi:hypothetical protein
VLPEGWRARPDHVELKLAAGERARVPVELWVPLNGTTGTQTVRFGFELSAGGHREFSAYRQLYIGQDSVWIEATAQLDASGQLEVRQRLINESDQAVSFRCNLFAPFERRQRSQVMNLGRGDDVHVYHLPDGKRMIGQTLWLRAEEIGGRRVLSYRFVVARP